MPHAYLLIGLEAAPLAVRNIVAAVPRALWDEHVDPARFSFRESVAHLADWEPILLERARAAIESPGSIIRAYDESDRAVEFGYAQTDPVAEAESLIARRRATVELLSRADGRWGNRVTHPERGELSLDELANLMLGHDHYHIEHLSRYLPKVPVD